MKSFSKIAGFIILFVSSTVGAPRGMISGTVKGPDGATFKGAFVRARNLKSKITAIVLSNRQGEYRIGNVTPGEYQVSATAVGYRSDVHNDVKVDGMQPVSLDFALQKGAVQWSDLSIHQGQVLLPDGPGKAELFAKCTGCHGFESRMAATRRDEDAWRHAVDDMLDPIGGMKFFSPLLGSVTDEQGAKIVSYINGVFGVDSELPRSPTALPGYDKVKHGEFSDEAMKITYVEYDLPGPKRFPWNANPFDAGNIWVPYYAKNNQIAKLNPETGEVQEFHVPSPGIAAIHSATVAPDGMVWFTEEGRPGIGKFDPKTQKFSEYQAPYNAKGKDALEQGKDANTVRVDRLGYVWISGAPLRRFDPRTEKFTEFLGIQTPSGIEFDQQGNLWFTEYPKEGKIGKVDVGTLKIKTWAPPTPKIGARRLAFDSYGIIWFTEYWAGQIGRFDPKTETFKEFPLPGSDPTPHAIGIDRNNFVWYNSDDNDILGRLNPSSGEIVEYPLPYPENGFKEIHIDSEGRMWFATPPNNKVGYFIPPE